MTSIITKLKENFKKQPVSTSLQVAGVAVMAGSAAVIFPALALGYSGLLVPGGLGYLAGMGMFMPPTVRNHINEQNAWRKSEEARKHAQNSTPASSPTP